MVRKTLLNLAEYLNASYRGDPDCEVHSMAAIEAANTGQICFVDNPRYRKYLANTKASIVILAAENADQCPTNVLICDDPYYSYARVAQLFEEPSAFAAGIHATADIDPSAEIHPSAHIGAFVSIGKGCKIAAECVIESHCVIGPDCQIDANTHLFPRVVLYRKVQIGSHCIIHSGCVIGSDGFGFAKHKGKWFKIPQLGRVIIGKGVDIGANTTIDRGALGDTNIGDHVILDNQIQIGHNVKIGARTAIAGCTGISGSTKIGEDCLIGGASGIAGHITITDNIAITGMSMVTKSLEQSGIYSSGTGVMPNKEWQKNAARFRKLDLLFTRVQQLEQNAWDQAKDDYDE